MAIANEMQVVGKRPIRNLRWWIGGLLFASTVINYLDRQTLSVLAPYLKLEYRWSNEQFALIIIAFRSAYAIGQTVSGRLIDRIGTRRGLTITVIWYSVASMLTAFAGGLRSFAFFRFLLGAGESANWPAATKAVAEWFPKRERGWAVALFDSGSSIGGAIAPLLVLGLYRYFGAWRITRAGDGTLYLVVARRSERGRIGDDDDGALYKSSDGGDNWTRMDLPEGTNGPMSLVLDPKDTQRMYLAAWGVARPSGDTGGGVFLSTDGGKSWRNIFNQSQHVYDLTVDEKNPRILYLCGFDSAAYRSTDGGNSWARIRGYNFKWGHRVILDPVNPDKIYITTFGGSVWHGPAAGDEDAVEDILTRLQPGQRTQ